MTITEMLELIYPYIKRPTLYTWLQRQLFRPSIYVAPPNGPGRQSYLSKADIVTVGILSNLFSIGIKFEQINMPAGTLRPEIRILFERACHEQIVETDTLFWKDEATTLELATDIGPGRQIQNFLEEFDFDVMMTLYRTRPDRIEKDSMVFSDSSARRRETLTDIHFYKSDLADSHKGMLGSRTLTEFKGAINVPRLSRIADQAMKMIG